MQYCNICNTRAVFLNAGSPIRPKVRCPNCQSLERHRLVCLYLHRHGLLESVKRLLHCAPEPSLSGYLRLQCGLKYITGDMAMSDVDMHFDLTCLPIKSNYFDAIICIHVLEHIVDDLAALTEIYRVMAYGAWAIFMVPIKRCKTYEDYSIRDEAGRLKAFGQSDHVRIYGEDFANRLEAAGFTVEKDDFVRRLSPSVILLHSLDSTESIFFCRKAFNSHS